MNLPDIRLLYEYNRWANGHILDTAEKVSGEAFARSTEHSHGSLRGTLAHILDAEEEWRTRLTDGHGTDYIDPGPDVASIRARWVVEEGAMLRYLDAVGDGDLDKTVRYTSGDQEFKRVAWHCIVHMIDHSTQHRAEAAAILTALGQSPGDVHFMHWMDNHRGK